MTLLSLRFRGDPRLQRAAENAPAMGYGERNASVGALQEALFDLGEPMPRSLNEDGFDGIFGSETVGAVKRFQKKHFLTVDGIAGRQTFAALDRLFLLDDPHFGDAEAERVLLFGALSGPPGTGPFTCTSARKGERSGS